MAKLLELQLQHQFSNEYSGLISFRIDWFDLLIVQGTLKSLLQHHSLKASILWLSAFFMVLLWHPYMTTWKTIALTLRIFVGKEVSVLYNMLSRFVVAFISRSKHVLISWLQSPSADFGAQENKVCHCFHFSPIYLPWSDGTWCHDLSFFECWDFSQVFHSPLSPSSRVHCTILDAWGWYTGTTQRDGVGREEGGGYRMWNTCIPVADSFWYLAKLIQLCKV